jgi:hypothetical protein
MIDKTPMTHAFITLFFNKTLSIFPVNLPPELSFFLPEDDCLKGFSGYISGLIE